MGEFYKDILTSYYNSLTKIDDRYRDLERVRVRHLWCEDKLREADQLCIQNGFKRISNLLLSGSVIVTEYDQKLIESTLFQVESRFQKYRELNKYLDDIKVSYEKEFKAVIEPLELLLNSSKKRLDKLEKQINQLKSARMTDTILFILAAFLSIIMSYWYALLFIIVIGFFSFIAYR